MFGRHENNKKIYNEKFFFNKSIQRGSKTHAIFLQMQGQKLFLMTQVSLHYIINDEQSYCHVLLSVNVLFFF